MGDLLWPKRSRGTSRSGVKDRTAPYPSRVAPLEPCLGARAHASNPFIPKTSLQSALRSSAGLSRAVRGAGHLQTDPIEPWRVCKLVRVITPLLLLLYGHHSWAG